jgi:hypothetical protein
MLDSSLRFAPPPRPVPFSLAIVHALNAFAQIGWGLFGFGSIFFWTFVTNADFSFFTFRGALANASGVVTRIENTRASEGRRTIRAHHYEYLVAGRTLTGVSYSNQGEVSEGDHVVVEYSADAPERSRIAGQRQKMFGPAVSFVTIFPLIGLGIVVGATRWGTRYARLLRDGVLTTGVLTSKKPTNVTVNRRRVYELTFDFTARDGRRCQAKARSSTPERLEDEHDEPLLYDPENPERVVLLDEDSSRPRFNEAGDLRARPVAALFAMVLPTIVIVANVLVLLIKLG